MTFEFSGVNTTTKNLTNGTTLVEFPVGTDFASVMKSGLTVKVEGLTVSTAEIVPNPSTLSLTDDEEVVFLYRGTAYQFKFSEGKYFTAVFLSDPHIAQNGHDGTSVEDMQAYISRIVNMGNNDGPHFAFDALPGYVPTCDIAFSLGDMDGDSEKTGSDFKTAHQGFNQAGIPFITLCGNHDLVPDYWTGESPDYGLTLSGASCNDIALDVVSDQRATAKNYGIENVDIISDGSKHIQANPFTFTFNGVRFYCGQTYWFQKPYTKPILLGSGTFYAPDGVINALKQFVGNHKDEPSVWMQHYPFVAGSDCDRWWLDQNDVGKYIKTNDTSIYGTDRDLGVYNSNAEAQSYAKKKKDALTYIINQTKNPVHFSGHAHYYAENTYNDLKDYTVAATGYNDGGLAGGYIVLMKGNKGVVEVKQVHFSETNNSGHDDTEMTEFNANATQKENAVATRLATALNSINDSGISAATAQLANATNTEAVEDAISAMNNAFGDYIENQSTESLDVTALLGANTNFETAQGNVLTTNSNIYPQTGWNEHVASFTNEENANYIHLRQKTDDGASTPTSIYLRAKWQAYTCTEQILKQAALPTGTYTLKFNIKKIGSFTPNLNYYEVNGQRTTILPTDNWEEQNITLIIYKPTLLTLSFGFTGGKGNTENAVSVDDITLHCTGTGSPYKKALHAAKALSTDVAQSAVKQFEWTDEELAEKSYSEIETATAVLNNAVVISNANNIGTSLIANADFTGGYIGNEIAPRVQIPNEWTFEYDYEGWNDTYVDASEKLFNAWAGTIHRAELTQMLVNLPNGIYRLSADVKTEPGDNAAISTIALYGSSGESIGCSENVGGNEFKNYSCEFDVANNSACIGIRSYLYYYQVKNFKLEYIRALAEGDVNHDGKVDVSDVTLLVNIVLNKATDEFNNADLDGNGNVDVGDVTTLVNIILGKYAK
ncbi:MAG: dockerin type I repeat-containing protein [Prevotella sp.]|nr:dockerin type I repeat-containing protein [Prevotella sp.]